MVERKYKAKGYSLVSGDLTGLAVGDNKEDLMKASIRAAWPTLPMGEKYRFEVSYTDAEKNKANCMQPILSRIVQRPVLTKKEFFKLNWVMNPFFSAYLECILWAESDQTDDQGGEPLERNYGCRDFTLESLVKAWNDCLKFQTQNAEALEAYYQEYCEEYAGHDFGLTRNRHGAGFWDRKYRKSEEFCAACDALTDASHKFREQYVSVYRGKVYIE